MIHIIPILRDNYCYIVEGADKNCIIIDPGQDVPVEQFIAARGLTPVLILNTHHHADHVAGNDTLQTHFRIPVAGPKAEMNVIPCIDKGYADGDVFSSCGFDFHVIETPGHTLGHIVFHVPALSALFAGDTLFSMGCGRLSEGTAAQMWHSLSRLKQLPSATQIYSGHEYTIGNGAFAAHVMPENAQIAARVNEAKKRRQNDMPTYPVLLETELQTNPFLMAQTVEEFAQLRSAKDVF